ncbi:hypothetical protein PRIC1_004564 [Phytophthora ramorum]
MVKFRLRKKEKNNWLCGELRRLESEMKWRRENLRRTKAINSAGCEQSKIGALQFLVDEKEALHEQNVALRANLEKHKLFDEVLLAESHVLTKKNELLLPSRNKEDGWRVHFPGGEPSFHFHPFTRGDFDAVVNACRTKPPSNLPSVRLAGAFLGWDVYQATATSVLGSQALLARARFTKRLHCSLRFAFEAMSDKDMDTWPHLVIPMNWGGLRAGRSTTRVLQHFDANGCVMVCNVQAQVDLRYICFAQRSPWTEQDGKRVVTYMTVIADSEANRRSRSAEANPDEVEWVTEGGSILTLTEADDNSIDVVYDHWGDSHDALHAQYMFVQWTHWILRWEQMVMPSSLLTGV